MPTAPACTGTALTDGVFANGGSTYVYAGGTSTLTVHFNGADVIICSGNLTLTSSSGFNGGRLYILGGATVNTDQSVLNTSIYNYGTLNINNNLTVNSAGLLMNSITGHMTINGNLSENTIITNYGISVITGTLTVTNAGSGACLGLDSKLNVNTIKYDWNINPIKVASGSACIGISGSNITGNVSLTSSSSVKICASGTLGINGSGSIGSAVLSQNCSSCAIALPIELISFDGKNTKEFIFLDWSTASEKNNDFFNVLHSYDGLKFNSIGQVGGGGTSDSIRYYSYKDYDAKTGINYYKLKQVDFDGNSVDSKVISVNKNDLEYNILIYPIPSPSPDIKLMLYKNFGLGNVKCIDINGRIIFSVNIDTNESLEYDFGKYSLPSGIYFIKIETDDCVYIKQIIINN
jgi:hypothetical protein